MSIKLHHEKYYWVANFLHHFITYFVTGESCNQRHYTDEPNYRKIEKNSVELEWACDN